MEFACDKCETLQNDVMLLSGRYRDILTIDVVQPLKHNRHRISEKSKHLNGFSRKYIY